MAAKLITSPLIPFRALICLCLVTFVVGCSKGKQAEGDSAAGVSPSTQSDFQGTSDSGGGNGINGRVLESYRFNPIERPEFEKYLSALIARTETDTKVLNNRLLYLLKKKNWYLIPVSLSTLSPEKIGTAFIADQKALQNFDEIWIDQKKYEAMPNDEERAKLLFHEIVMGLKILRFDSEFNNCLALCDAVRGTDADNLKACEQFKNSTRSALSLSKQDYSDIRFVTDEVFLKRETISSVRFAELLKFKNFDAKIISYSYEQDIKKVSSQEILNLIASNSQTQIMPRFSGFDSRGESKMQCSLSWELPDKQAPVQDILKLKVSLSDSLTNAIVRSENFEFQLPDSDKPYEAYPGIRIGEKVLNTIELRTKVDLDLSAGHVLKIDFENEQIRSIRIFKFVFVPGNKPGCVDCTAYESKYANTSVSGNEPLFCYFKENLPKDFDLIANIQDQ